MKPKIPKCTYCGMPLTCYSLGENVWACENCGFFFKVFNGKPYPKRGYYKEEVIALEETQMEEISGDVCRRCGKELKSIAEKERGVCFDCWAEFSGRSVPTSVPVKLRGRL